MLPSLSRKGIKGWVRIAGGSMPSAILLLRSLHGSLCSPPGLAPQGPAGLSLNGGGFIPSRQAASRPAESPVSRNAMTSGS